MVYLLSLKARVTCGSVTRSDVWAAATDERIAINIELAWYQTHFAFSNDTSLGTLPCILITSHTLLGGKELACLGADLLQKLIVRAETFFECLVESDTRRARKAP